MDLGSILTLADSGLANVNRGLVVVGQNVANAGTPGWAREVSQQQSLTSGGLGMGVRTLPTQRQLDTVLQAAVFAQNATAAGLQTRQTALSGIDQVQGTVAAGNDLGSLLGKLQDSFSTLLTDPANQTQQQAVVGAAGSLARQINALAGAVGQARQTAQDQAVSDVATLNATLSQIGQLSDQIVSLQAAGQSTADLQNQRDAVVSQLGALLPVRALSQANGDVQLVTSSGLNLPIHGASNPFQLAAATLGPGVTYPASAAVPALTLGGHDVTGQLGGSGQLAADFTLRDTTLPAYQGTLDEFAHTLATRFDQQGLTLFTDGGASVPAATGPLAQSGYVGFAQSITVNPAVVAQPSLVRDGSHAVTGSPTGASAFTPNPAGGPAGFTDLISRVLNYALGANAQAGVAQAAPATTGLGPAGDQSAGFLAPADLAGFATALVGGMSGDSSQASTDLTAAQSLQTALQSKLNNSSGVSVDTEMSTMIQLQNAYGANAKIISSVQTMWDTLIAMVIQ